jgi:FixJ family two-component response regulator
LTRLQESEDDIPFIVLSGTIDEGVAVEAMKAGAHDYLTRGSCSGSERSSGGR